MPYLQFESHLIEYTPQRSEGELCTREDAKYLNSLLATEVQYQANLWVRAWDATPTPEAIQAKVSELCTRVILPETPDDPVTQTALAIAKEKITARLAAEGLPPPAGLDLHAAELVRLYPALLSQAELRVKAQLTVVGNIAGAT